MDSGYDRVNLSDLETNPEKPSPRWEVSPQLDIEGYNFNIAILNPGDRLSQTAYHYHRDQEEFFYIIDGQCRVETTSDSFDLGADGMVVFRKGAVHLLHNPYDAPCKLIAIGYPPEGRRPVHMVKSYREILEERA